MKPATRPLVRWEAEHDNGWKTVIVEQGQGVFAAWAGEQETTRMDYIGGNVAHASAAVLAALRRKSGHRRCSVNCADWSVRQQ